jgi:hypothetical protein
MINANHFFSSIQWAAASTSFNNGVMLEFIGLEGLLIRNNLIYLTACITQSFTFAISNSENLIKYFNVIGSKYSGTPSCLSENTGLSKKS